MAILALKVLDKDSNTICVSSGENFVDLVCTHTYEEGDRIVLETDEKNIHVHLQVDDALGDAFVYITDNVSYYVPFGEKRISMSPKVFSGNKHYLYAEVAREDEITAYRNLALNPADQHMDGPCQCGDQRRECIRSEKRHRRCPGEPLPRRMALRILGHQYAG